MAALPPDEFKQAVYDLTRLIPDAAASPPTAPSLGASVPQAPPAVSVGR